MLDLDTGNASASDNSTVWFPKSGDSAGRENRLVTMMNSTLLFTTVVLDGALPAATEDLPQENMNYWSRLARALLTTLLVEVAGSCRGFGQPGCTSANGNYRAAG